MLEGFGQQAQHGICIAVSAVLGRGEDVADDVGRHRTDQARSVAGANTSGARGRQRDEGVLLDGLARRQDLVRFGRIDQHPAANATVAGQGGGGEHALAVVIGLDV